MGKRTGNGGPAMGATSVGSGRSLDLVVKQRSRDDVSSEAAALRLADPRPDHTSVSSALDTGGSAALPTLSSSTVTGRHLLTADDVALILQVPRSLVYALARRGDLPTVRIGERYVRFRATTIERWIQSQEACEVQQLARAPARRAMRRKRSASSRDAVG